MNNDSETNSDRSSVHSNWSELTPINNGMNKNASTTNSEVIKGNAQSRKRAIKNIVLVPYKPKPKDGGSWKVKSPYTTSTIASPSLNVNQQTKIMQRWSMFCIVHITLQFTHQSSMEIRKFLIRY